MQYSVRSLFKGAALSLLILGLCLGAFLAPASAAGDYTIMDAGLNGAFNIGASEGDVRQAYDDEAGRDVLMFNYTAPVGTVIGLWTKSFPSELVGGAADTVELAVRVPDADQVNEIAVTVELKGSKAVQAIPLTLQHGWSATQAFIDWGLIGDLQEVVFVLNPANQPGGAQGTIYINADFHQLPFLQTLSASISGKMTAVLLISLLVGLLAALVRALFSRKDASLPVFTPPSILRDMTYGLSAVLGAALVVWTYSIAQKPLLEAGTTYLLIAVGSALVAAFLKYGLTGRHITATEAFQDVFLTGMLTAACSSLVLLQAPSAWQHVFFKSGLTVAVTLLVYHIMNGITLATYGKHVRPTAGALIVATPYIFGSLLLLESPDLLVGLSTSLFGSLLASQPALAEAVGRLIVVFAFNEAVTNGISLATRRRLLTTFKAHTFILFVSLWVISAPWIADLGSTAAVAAMHPALRSLVGVLTAILSQAGLWAEVYLITGMVLDAMHGTAPSWATTRNHATSGMSKGMMYSGILMAILYGLYGFIYTDMPRQLMTVAPVAVGILSGALVFPLMKTVIETFDGSQAFVYRMRYSYRSWTLYLRGAVVGYGIAYGIAEGIWQYAIQERCLFGLYVGMGASVGVSFLRDVINTFTKKGKIQSWRLYFTDALLGGFIGSAMAFYLDTAQVPVIAEKLKLYNSAGLNPEPYTTWPLVNKWGRIDLGTYAGGTRLLFNESLAGVINWSIAAWLFAINRTFLQAAFQRDKAPIKFFFSRQGFAQLIEHMIQVLRWGLWMSPIIFTFLRMMGEATWYNQDGAIRTLVATYQSATLSPEQFQAWSLEVFVGILAFDLFRILIWIDHMGLRVATLVNLSFIGMDKLDERIARFIGPAATQRYIPEAVKRFTTWAPLLIPFYIPRGEDWNYAWSKGEAMQQANADKGILAWINTLSVPQLVFLLGAAVAVCTLIVYVVRKMRERAARRVEGSYELSNTTYKVTMKENGEALSQVIQKGYDLTRRSYDTMDPAGRALFVVDADEAMDSDKRTWPVIGNFPRDRFASSSIERGDGLLKVKNESNGVKTTIDVSIPDRESTIELWNVTMENTTDAHRKLKLVPYLEWLLDRPDSDRGHTQYARLFPEMRYVGEGNAVLAWQKNSKSMGILAADLPPEGFSASRMDFIGRAQSLWKPRLLQTLKFLEPKNTAPYPTFDPIGSLLMGVELGPKGCTVLKFMVGCADDKKAALELIEKHLSPKTVTQPNVPDEELTHPEIRHGEILPGTPQPYSSYADHGRKLVVHTPFTTRPYDHAMSNSKGHYMTVTNRGFQTSSSGNAQQNRLTPDWPDTVTREIPSEAIYMYDAETSEWFSPTYHPINDMKAKYTCAFSVDGTAVFHMHRGDISTEMTVFVPKDDAASVYELTIRNASDETRRMRVAPYFQIVLAGQPEWSGPLHGKYDKSLNAIFYRNPRNSFRSGPAFASMSIPADCVETKRGRFFGAGRGADHPYMVEKGIADETQLTDERAVAAMVGTLEIPAKSEQTVVIVLGQTESQREAAQVINKYKSAESTQASLEETRTWWTDTLNKVQYQTSEPEFDELQHWLKYQAIAERIWARRGFYQTSGAFGFRDQLQDTVNLLWMDPTLARKQLLLHASQQFLEGDVVHWFHTMSDGRTAFANRTHASDNLLWMCWGVVEYVNATGDKSILEEVTSYLMSETPFEPLPKNKHGCGSIYPRSARADTVYRHCMKAIDLVLKKRMGVHGLPLIGTGDWNDGLDEIGSEGRGESVWLGFFLHYILKNMIPIIERHDGVIKQQYYLEQLKDLEKALESSWRNDRYLRAYHDDGTEIGVEGAGYWEIDALTGAWAVMSGINKERARTVFDTTLRVLEQGNTILLGWPALREDTKPYLGRSSKYPEGVRENGMYCHGVQWMIRASRILVEQYEAEGNHKAADTYRETGYRMWRKITPVAHVTPEEIEIYGGQPNKQPADILTTYDKGRMIWNGYTGAAAWLFRQAIEGVIGARLRNNEILPPHDLNKPRGKMKISRLHRTVDTAYTQAIQARLTPQRPASSHEVSQREMWKKK